MRHSIPGLALLLAACTTPTVPSTPTQSGSGDGSSSSGPVASVGGCQIFPPDNAWNRDVSGDPVAPSSATLLANMSANSPIHLDLGTSEEYYGIPYAIVPQSQPLVPITFGTDGADYSSESDPGPMPIPLDVHIEGGSTADPNPTSGDRHVLVVQQGSCILYELYNTVRTGSGFMVSSSAKWNLKVNSTRPPTWTSADAAGLPILPGLLKHGEVAGGQITHALRFTVPNARRAYIAPAGHCGPNTDPNLPPYGLRARLKAGFDLSPYSGDALVILTALKKYGLIFADQGSPWYVTGTTDPAWQSALDQLRTYPVRGSDFELLELGPVTTC
jgi:hypothetical protein